MGEAFALPSDNKAFNPTGGSIPVTAVPEPRLGKVYEFDPTRHRHPRPVPEVSLPENIFKASAEGSIPLTEPPPPMEKQGPVNAMYKDTIKDTMQFKNAPPVPPAKPPQVATGAAAPDEEPSKISAERLAFLVRVEALVGAESRISDLQSENKALISIVSRLQREVEDLKKGAQKA